MISIDNLEHIVAFVENQGVIRASEKIFISTSSVDNRLLTIVNYHVREKVKALRSWIGRAH